MNGWMNEWVKEWMNEWMDEWSLHSHSLCLCTSHSLCTPILFVFQPPTVSALPFSLYFNLPQSLHCHSLCISTSQMISHSLILPAFTPCSSPPSIPLSLSHYFSKV